MGNCCSAETPAKPPQEETGGGEPIDADATMDLEEDSVQDAKTVDEADMEVVEVKAEEPTVEEKVPEADPLEESYVREKLGQNELMDSFANDESKKVELLKQLGMLDKEYPGGLAKYIENAKKLLKESKEGVNPYDGYGPTVPQGERLTAETPSFHENETLGMEHIGKAGFVLVAGGLGERLGYNGIKVALPAEILTGKCFLQNYCEHILALQDRSRASSGNKNLTIPLAIMTSGDTHEKTVALLKENENFGMAQDQITIMKQEKVPAIIDNEGHFAIDEATGLVETKPHGHGDVHSLIHCKGVLEQWKNTGVEWVIFFQDTNGLVFRGLVAALGVSVKNSFDVNSLTVPRRPGEAVGGICQLVSTKDDQKSLTINVEYNQLDPLLRATVSPEGDVPDESGFSPYPGNINVLIFKLQSYASVLAKTGGGIPEFVNPKYADAEKTKFKKPTRLECMMQDYPKLLADDPNAKVGFTQLERFISFSAVKNNPVDALDKFKSTGFAESASSGESDIYALNRELLRMAGVDVKTKVQDHQDFLGLPFPLAAKVVLAPSFGTTIAEVKSRFPQPELVSISERSCLVLEGDVTVKDLKLDGYLRITAGPGVKLTVQNLNVVNEGIDFASVNTENKYVDEIFRIRGYNKDVKETRVIEEIEVGEKVVDGQSEDAE